MAKRRLVGGCAACHRQTSVTAGTVLHKTHTPLHLWFWTANLMSTPTPGVSALQLQLQVRLSCAQHMVGARSRGALGYFGNHNGSGARAGGGQRWPYARWHPTHALPSLARLRLQTIS